MPKTASPEELQARLDHDDWLLPGEVATLLNMSRSTVVRMLNQSGSGFRYRLSPGGIRSCCPDSVRQVMASRVRKSGGANGGIVAYPQPAPSRRGTELYRHFDAENRLLYVGITDFPRDRRIQHSRRSTWSEYAVRTETEMFPDRRSAEAAEESAIQSEQPLFNYTHNDTPEGRLRLVKYLIEKDRLDLLMPVPRRG